VVESAIVAIEQHSDLRVFAVAPSATGVIELSLDDLDDSLIALELALYDESLAERNIAEGELTRSGGTPPERRVPDTGRVYATTIDGASAESWFPIGRLSDTLAGFRFPGIDPIDPCTQYVQEVIELSAHEKVASTAAFSDDELIVFTTSTSYAVQRGSVRVLQLRLIGETTSSRVVNATTIDASGRVWGSLADGTLAELTLEGSELLARVRGRLSLPESELRWLATTELDGEPEHFVLTSTGALYRHHAGVSSVLHQFTGDSTLSGAVSVLGPREALAVFRYNTGKVLHYANGRIEDEVVPTTVLDRLVSLATLPGAGTVVGTDDGKLFRRGEGGRWSSVDEMASAVGLTITSFTSDPAGFAFGAGYSNRNWLGRWIEADKRLCMTGLMLRGNRPVINRLGESFAVIMSRDMPGTRVQWLSPAR
jgi:hypothetical protein